MRDLAVLGFMLIFLPLALTNTFSAYLLWGWAGLIALNSFLYGQMAGVPYVQIFALIALGLILVGKDQDAAKFESNRTTVLFTLVLVHGLMSALFAYPGLYRNWELYTNMVKTLLFCILMPMLVTNRFRVHAFVLMLAFGVGFHGLLDGLKFIASAGAHLAQGIQKFGDNNHFAMVLVMILPMLFYLFKYSGYRLVRYGFIAVFVLVCLAVVATNSRGGLLSLMVFAFWVVMTSRRKIAGSVAIIALSLLILQLVPDRWTQRMDTIQTAQEDSSFMGRVAAWKIASAIALENPILGGGYHAGQAPSIFEQFRSKPGLLGFVNTPNLGYPAATHSIYFEVLGDLGIVGLILFLACLVNAYITHREILKIALAGGQNMLWASDLSNLLVASLVVFMVGGAALSAAYFELPYILMMLLEVLKKIADKNRQMINS